MAAFFNTQRVSAEIMTPPRRSSLRTFLSLAKSTLQNPPKNSTLRLVIGNESADLDSLTSALLYSFFRTHSSSSLQSPTPSAPFSLHIPISNLPQQDLALRPELTAALAFADLQPSDLITNTDLSRALSNLDPSIKTSWFLVDHNALTAGWKRYNNKVVGCVDHHADEGIVPRDLEEGQGEVRVIETCGSCMSLVVNTCRGIWDGIEGEAEGKELDKQMAKIALSAILVDTIGMSSKEKVTSHDETAVTYLEAKLDGDSDGYDRQGHFQQVEDLKQNLSRMSFRDVLRKDYKEWTSSSPSSPLKLGISSIPQPLGYVLAKSDGPMSSLKEYAAEKELDILVLMTIVRSNGFGRELFAWGLNEQGAEVVVKFEEKFRTELGLRDWRGEGTEEKEDLEKRCGHEWRKAWNQGNVAASRKQVAPMIRELMEAEV